MSVDTNPPAGAPDKRGVQASMREAAQRAQELLREAEAARASLNEAASKVQELERQAAQAQKTIARYQEQENIFAHALEDAQRVSEEKIQAARARAEEADRASNEIIETANARAEEAGRAGDDMLQAAEARAEELVTSAKATAEEIIRSARNTAADTLHNARESAQEQLEAAERAAEGGDSDRPRGGVPPNIEKTKQAAEQYLTGIVTKLDAFIHDRERVSRSLEALAKSHAESVETMGRLKSEVQKEILPTVQRLLRGLKGEDAGKTPGWTQGKAEPKVATKAEAKVQSKVEAKLQSRVVAEVEVEPDVEPEAEPETEAEIELEPAAEQPASIGLIPQPLKPDRPAKEQDARLVAARASGSKYSGEVVISPIQSFMQATKFITALTHVEGVAGVKLRTYAGSKLTVDVLTENQPVGAIDCALIDGFPIEVVESADNHLVLRIGSPTARPTPR